jgi:hypothetical protein
MRKSLLTIILMIFCAHSWAQDNSTVADADSIDKVAEDPDFITVSLMWATPGKEIYSLIGHSLLRLQCPSNNFDIAYSFAMDVTPGDIFLFIQGKAMSGYIYTSTQDKIDEYRSEGREVNEVKLNLTPKQKQNLWRFLDIELQKGPDYHYDYLHTQCASMTIFAIESILDGETIVYKDLPEEVRHEYGSHRIVLKNLCKNSPWQFLFWDLTLGTHGDNNKDFNGRLAPEILWHAWQHASIKDKDGNLRPMTLGKPHVLAAKTCDDGPFPITPWMAFGALLLIVAISVYTDFKGKTPWLGRTMDIILMTGHTVTALWITYLVVFSQLIATNWNWMILVFNPLPLLLWLCGRKKKWMHWCYLAFACVPLLYIILTPVIPQMLCSPSLCLVMAAFSLRAITDFKKK